MPSSSSPAEGFDAAAERLLASADETERLAGDLLRGTRALKADLLAFRRENEGAVRAV